MTGGAHDTLRDELGAVITPLWQDDSPPGDVVDALLPVVLRYAATQVAARLAAVRCELDDRERYWNDDFGWCIPVDVVDRALGAQP